RRDGTRGYVRTGRARLQNAMRRGVGNDRAVDRIPVFQTHRKSCSETGGEIRPVRDLQPPGPVSRNGRGAELSVAVFRGSAPGRGDESAHDDGHRHLWQTPAQTTWRAHPDGGSVEIRVQEHQVRGEDRIHHEATENFLGDVATGGIPVRIEREPERAPSALVAGHRADY